MKFIAKKVFIVLLFAAIVINASIIISIPRRQKVEYGVTFSQKFVEELGLDWQAAYLAILDDLKVRELRLIAYWDKVEPEENRFNFADLDWQVAEAENRGAKIVLALGKKTPRWPECHIPNFAREFSISNSQFPNKFEESLLKYLQTTIEHYSKSNAVIAWQIENEPLFPFGECGMIRAGLLNEEIDLVKSLDSRPIILTDAGELGFAWPYLAGKSDIFGTTLYRYVSNRVLGNIKYWFIPVYFFRIKAWWASKILGKEILISELQAEPWSQASLAETSFEDQAKSMSPEKFKEIIEYAERSGFPKAYLWGVEWWYWMKEKKAMPEMWEAAMQQITNNK